MNKLEQCLSKMSQYPKVFYFSRQITKNITGYFDIRFGYKVMPADFLMFMSFLDGLKTNNYNIFSIYKENKHFKVSTFEECSTEDATLDYLDEVNLYLGVELFFFANDNQGGRFAFKKNSRENQVFYIPNEKNAKIITYDNFTSFLEELIKEEIENYKTKRNR